jgi:hypothetical protein
MPHPLKAIEVEDIDARVTELERAMEIAKSSRNWDPMKILHRVAKLEHSDCLRFPRRSWSDSRRRTMNPRAHCPIRGVCLAGIPKGLNAEQTEKFLRQKGALLDDFNCLIKPERWHLLQKVEAPRNSLASRIKAWSRIVDSRALTRCEPARGGGNSQR